MVLFVVVIVGVAVAVELLQLVVFCAQLSTALLPRTKMSLFLLCDPPYDIQPIQPTGSAMNDWLLAVILASRDQQAPCMV